MIVSDYSTNNVGALNATYTIGCDAADTVGIQITGTFAGTLTFQASIDGGNWVTAGVLPVGTTTPTTWVTTTTTGGVWTRSCEGLKWFRVQMTAYTSGTAVVGIVGTRHSK